MITDLCPRTLRAKGQEEKNKRKKIVSFFSFDVPATRTRTASTSREMMHEREGIEDKLNEIARFFVSNIVCGGKIRNEATNETGRIN